TGPQLGTSGHVIIIGGETYNGPSIVSEGTLETSPGQGFDFNAGLQLNGSARLQIPASSSMNIAGDLVGNTQNVTDSPIQGTLTLDGSGTVNAPQRLEVMSRDLGNTPAGFLNNDLLNILALANNTYVKLVDLSDNASGTGPEALYVNSLIVPAGTTLELG